MYVPQKYKYKNGNIYIYIINIKLWLSNFVFWDTFVLDRGIWTGNFLVFVLPPPLNPIPTTHQHIIIIFPSKLSQINDANLFRFYCFQENISGTTETLSNWERYVLLFVRSFFFLLIPVSGISGNGIISSWKIVHGIIFYCIYRWTWMTCWFKFLELEILGFHWLFFAFYF